MVSSLLILLSNVLITINKSAIPTVKLQNSASPDSYMPFIGLGTAIPAQYPEYKTGYDSATKWLSIGGRFIDEAHGYPSKNGVTQAVKDYTNNYSKIKRSELFIQTKVAGISGNQLGYNDVINAVNEELALWNTTYFDSMLLHWPSDHGQTHPSSDPACRNEANNKQFNASLCRQHSWRAMIELYNNGTLKAIGVSNFEQKHLADLFDYKYDGKVYLPAVNQMQFHGYDHEYNFLDYCHKNNITFNSWSTLGTPDVEKGKWTGNTPILTQHPIAMNIGKKYNKSAAQIWLRWQYQLNVVAIPRSNDISHMQQNMDIFDFQLTEDDMSQLYNVTAPPYPNNLVHIHLVPYYLFTGWNIITI
eukprot:76675_1